MQTCPTSMCASLICLFRIPHTPCSVHISVFHSFILAETAGTQVCSSSMPTITLYHGTSEANAREIQSKGYMNESDAGEHGPGVYFALEDKVSIDLPQQLCQVKEKGGGERVE